MNKEIIFVALLFFIFNFSLLAQIEITIDVSQSREPISQYIYGQFIEHLGRCIYGGIWAEMLEDRKFYYPITDVYNPFATATDPFWKAREYKYLNASPWQVIGPAGTVKMDSVHAFTGAHSPVIQLPGDGTAAGIRQPGLALVKGKEYTGRIVLTGDPEAAPVEVRLVLDNGKMLRYKIKSLYPEFRTYPFQFKAPASSSNSKLEIVSTGKGHFTIGTVSLMPADNIKGWRRDVVALLKELNSPIYRWPGGNFVSGYNWRDGIGERDKRPPRKNPAWKGVESNDVGIHEFMDLMDLLDAEPYLAVNTGLGTVAEVAEEVEYCNGGIDTPMGKWRAQNGHLEPYHVTWWAVGNEMYGSWQLGHMPLSEYVKKHNCVAEAMRKVDPKVKLVGVGEVGQWSETMLRVCSENMDLISEHIYCKDKPEVLAHTRQLAEQIKAKAEAHRKYRNEIPELKGKDIRIAMDEWNFWYGDYIYGELGVQYHLKDALGVAIALHEYFHNSDLYYMANYAQTVNVIGCIKTSPTDAVFDATGLPLKLYRQHFGTIPVNLSGETGDLDISAALTADRKALTVAMVNPTATLKTVHLNVMGFKLGNRRSRPSREKITKWTIAGSDPELYNAPDQTPNLVIKEEKATLTNDSVEVPAYGIVLVRVDLIKE
ncbi:MAG: alpha-N-arabinofuranosidase [candidate division KSB1 bacterium]|nr:alpha-N-arabinofuranosidase [candidate division KSB1 bacterium]